jgi:hypothetical protein
MESPPEGGLHQTISSVRKGTSNEKIVDVYNHVMRSNHGSGFCTGRYSKISIMQILWHGQGEIWTQQNAHRL